MSSQRLQVLTDKLKADVAAKKIPGAVLLIARHGKVAYFESVGKLGPADDVPMSRDGIFRIYSMSKPLTTVAAMMLVEDGRLKLEDPVSMYLPEFAKPLVGVEKPGPDGKRILGPQTIAFMTADHATTGAGITPGPLYLPGAGYGFGLGFAVRRSNGEAPVPSAAGEYNWAGAGGTSMWVDPRNDMLVVFMAQSPSQRGYLRNLVRNMVYSAIAK